MNVITDKNLIDKLLNRRVANDGFFSSEESIKARLMSGERLSFYYGIDPTGRDIHLGHTVQLFLLKGLAELGHQIILLIGDFTAKIGDPTGKDKSRPPLKDEDISENMRTYLPQVCKILPRDNFIVRYNSEWLKNMTMNDLLGLASNVTVQQMIARDMFQERPSRNKPIGLHEFLYPLMQGYDSVALKVDGEVGGHDQIFNMLVGRDLEKKYLNKDKIVLATKLLVDESTGKKMSKSEGEIIALNDEPSEIRRKILAIDDKMTRNIFELCTDKDQEWINEQGEKLSGRDLKELLADKLVELYHGKSGIQEAHKPRETEASGNLAMVIRDLGFTSSISEAKKLVENGAVEINDSLQKDWSYQPKVGDRIKVGKGKFGIIK